MNLAHEERVLSPQVGDDGLFGSDSNCQLPGLELQFAQHQVIGRRPRDPGADWTKTIVSKDVATSRAQVIDLLERTIICLNTR